MVFLLLVAVLGQAPDLEISLSESGLDYDLEYDMKAYLENDDLEDPMDLLEDYDETAYQLKADAENYEEPSGKDFVENEEDEDMARLAKSDDDLEDPMDLLEDYDDMARLAKADDMLEDYDEEAYLKKNTKNDYGIDYLEDPMDLLEDYNAAYQLKADDPSEKYEQSDFVETEEDEGKDFVENEEDKDMARLAKPDADNKESSDDLKDLMDMLEDYDEEAYLKKNTKNDYGSDYLEDPMDVLEDYDAAYQLKADDPSEKYEQSDFVENEEDEEKAAKETKAAPVKETNAALIKDLSSDEDRN